MDAADDQDPTQLVRMVVDLEGILQGVGFRPTMQVLAEAAGLGGSVQNRSGSVRLTLEGPRSAVLRFVAELPARLPPNARLDAVRQRSLEPLGTDELPGSFRIEASAAGEEVRISIPADLAMCPDCRREVYDPASRFFGYPFTTCTRCGPRYTVVRGMPYDREQTTLSVFPLCPACRAEYENMRDRRFHAESIACPACGPRLEILDPAGRPQPGPALPAARRALRDGEILAVRGLGGFLLAVDARRADAVARLRERKHRPAKPFALMARNLDVVARHLVLDDEARRLLSGPAAPILVLPLRPGARAAAELPWDELSPDSDTVGVMLPTTPLQALLADPAADDGIPPFDLLVMTSGNRGGEPPCIRTAEALDRLAGIADRFLVHDREINLRCDDSVAAPGPTGPQLWRRARGFAPEGLRVDPPLRRRILALGAELKSTIAVGARDEVVLSPHVGDLETPEALADLETVVRRFPEFLRLEPEAIAVDLHPDMHATRLGRALAGRLGLPVVAVQHHHAHAAAALAEAGRSRALALVFDGTGLGPDGAIWGGELLALDGPGCDRLGTFRAVPLPGGDAAVRHPVRQLVARLLDAAGEVPPAWRERLRVTDEQLELWTLQCRRGLASPPTHAVGRLFDAAAVLLGAAPEVVTYEAQAAVRLETLAARAAREPVPDERLWTSSVADGRMVVDFAPLFRRFAERRPDAAEAGAWAFAFHAAVADAAAALAR
ncbi:MAG: carbamoyltransferase HypF, partial [Deltaproteobacteria bacterium]|nr:carbamoyltransferase HypF [Deltaproteobacteria bacterium]